MSLTFPFKTTLTTSRWHSLVHTAPIYGKNNREAACGLQRTSEYCFHNCQPNESHECCNPGIVSPGIRMLRGKVVNAIVWKLSEIKAEVCLRRKKSGKKMHINVYLERKSCKQLNWNKSDVNIIRRDYCQERSWHGHCCLGAETNYIDSSDHAWHWLRLHVLANNKWQ